MSYGNSLSSYPYGTLGSTMCHEVSGQDYVESIDALARAVTTLKKQVAESGGAENWNGDFKHVCGDKIKTILGTFSSALKSCLRVSAPNEEQMIYILRKSYSNPKCVRYRDILGNRSKQKSTTLVSC